jgi:putative membrane protein
MKKVLALSVATCLLAGVAMAQTPTQPSSPNATVAPPNTVTGQSHNPAVAATSNANDTTAPAKGSNSFTEAQAKDRIGQRGYTNVSALKKDDAGVWRGSAQHSGSDVKVWLDYKGNVGETP